MGGDNNGYMGVAQKIYYEKPNAMVERAENIEDTFKRGGIVKKETVMISELEYVIANLI